MARRKMTDKQILELVSDINYCREINDQSVSNALKYLCKNPNFPQYCLKDFEYMRGVYYRYTRGELKIDIEEAGCFDWDKFDEDQRIEKEEREEREKSKRSIWRRIKNFFLSW